MANRSDLERRVEQVRAYARALGAEHRLMDRRRRILEPLLFDEDVKAGLRAKLEKTDGVAAYDILPPTLGGDLVRDLVRLTLDDGPKAASVVNIFRKAAADGVHREFRERFTTIPDRFGYHIDGADDFSPQARAQLEQDLRTRDRAEYEADFDRTWARVRAAVDGLATDATASRLRTFRDKHHGHLEMTPLGEEPRPFEVAELGLTFNDVLGFADMVAEPISDLIRLITGENISTDEFAKIHADQGADFWRRLACS